MINDKERGLEEFQPMEMRSPRKKSASLKQITMLLSQYQSLCIYNFSVGDQCI